MLLGNANRSIEETNYNYAFVIMFIWLFDKFKW